MGLLDGLLGATMGSVVTRLIDKHGGLQGIVNHLHGKGLGDTVQSWVGVGPNRPISAEQVHHAFDAETLQKLSDRLGMHPQDLAQKLAQILPQAVDKLTPNGALPKL